MIAGLKCLDIDKNIKLVNLNAPIVNILQYKHVLTHYVRFLCEVPGCGKFYSRESNLKYHMNSTHNKERTIYFCFQNECSYKCNLKEHLWIVHNIGEGMIFSCDNCEYKTKRKVDLVESIVIFKIDFGVSHIF